MFLFCSVAVVAGCPVWACLVQPQHHVNCLLLCIATVRLMSWFCLPPLQHHAAQQDQYLELSSWVAPTTLLFGAGERASNTLRLE